MPFSILLGGRLRLTVGNWKLLCLCHFGNGIALLPELDADDESRLRSFLEAVIVVELTGEVKTAAIELRRRHVAEAA